MFLATLYPLSPNFSVKSAKCFAKMINHKLKLCGLCVLSGEKGCQDSN
jgi:hypothetical protein